MININNPEIQQNIDLLDLKNVCQEYINYINSEEYHEDNDYKHYIYETALETIFGKDVWDFVNSKI